MDLINGVKISEEIKQEIFEQVIEFKNTYNRSPGLSVILVGTDPASSVYVRTKEREANKLGMISNVIKLNSNVTEEELINQIYILNNDHNVHGILVQLPLPDHINENIITEAINPLKDVDGLNPFNIGLLASGYPRFIPATPSGIQQILLRSGYNIQGEHVVVLGRSNIVGKPLSNLLSMKSLGGNATVTLCHSRTNNIIDICRSADILVAAIGIPNYVTSHMVSEKVIAIDVGINRVNDSKSKKGYKLVGDIDFEDVANKISAITPVPGGVGPMTIAMLLENTLKAALMQAKN